MSLVEKMFLTPGLLDRAEVTICFPSQKALDRFLKVILESPQGEQFNPPSALETTNCQWFFSVKDSLEPSGSNEAGKEGPQNQPPHHEDLKDHA